MEAVMTPMPIGPATAFLSPVGRAESLPVNGADTYGGDDAGHDAAKYVTRVMRPYEDTRRADQESAHQQPKPLEDGPLIVLGGIWENRKNPHRANGCTIH
jgi:hypothetical protein